MIVVAPSIFCGGNCFQKVNGTDLVAGTRELFPAVTNFSTYIPAMTGHGVNAHFSAPETYLQIQKWIASLPCRDRTVTDGRWHVTLSQYT